MKKEYKIYKAENIINGFIYIGATSGSIEDRKKDHLQKAGNNTGYQFQEAIGTYGPDAFSWEQIDTAANINELASKEKEYILEYKTNNSSYNTDGGGGFKKDVYQYNLDGTLNQTFNDLQSAANEVNATVKKISKVCLSVNQISDDYYWSYDLVELYTPNKDKRRKEVIKMSIEGIVLATYQSVAEASRLTGVSKSSIAKTCRKEQGMAGGYLWKYCN